MTSDRPGAGRFPVGAFPAVLRSFMMAAADGRLEVVSDAGASRLWLESGQVRAVVSDVEEEKLGQWLVGRGIIDRQHMAIMLLRQPEGVRYGTFLVMEGLLDAERLERELEAQAMAIVSRLLFVEGEYRLDPHDRVPNDAATLEMTTANLLAVAVRAVPDAQQLPGLARPDRYLASCGDPLLQLQHVQLMPSEGYLLSRVDGSCTVATLQRLAPMTPDQFARSLAVLLVTGLVEGRDGPEVRARPASELAVRARPEPVQRPAEEDLAYSPMEQREHEEVLQLASRIGKRNFYDRLGVGRQAGNEQIQTRYREMLRQYHPDRGRERHLRSLQSELGTIYRALQEASETLSNPESRGRYDKSLVAASVTGTGRLSSEGEHEEARRALVRNNLAQARRLMSLNDFGEAAQLLDQVVRMMPDPETLLLLAQVEFRNPMWAQRALDRLRHAVALNPKFTKGWLELANYWGMRSQTDKQKQCLEKILAYDPGNQDARGALNAVIEAQPRRRLF